MVKIRAPLSRFSNRKKIEVEVIDVDTEGEPPTTTDVHPVEVIIIDELGDSALIQDFAPKAASWLTGNSSGRRKNIGVSEVAGKCVGSSSRTHPRRTSTGTSRLSEYRSGYLGSQNSTGSVISLNYDEGDDEEDDDYDAYDYLDVNGGYDYDDLMVLSSTSCGVNRSAPLVSHTVDGHLDSLKPKPSSAEEARLGKKKCSLTRGLGSEDRGSGAVVKRRRTEAESSGSSSPFFQVDDPPNRRGNHTYVNTVFKSSPFDRASSSMAISDPPLIKCRSDNRGACAGPLVRDASGGGGEGTRNSGMVFGQFGIVQDHDDHYYNKEPSMKRPSKNWVKNVQKEWRILQSSLPDTIFVRVYETRLDLLRAAIIGAEGTPYRDGLFFFDMFFPSNYPNTPPVVHYQSWGLRVNPNLYSSGRVCLSLLNTWVGHETEKWVAGVSNVLQVLVSIQGLVLNSAPYFNEPGYAFMDGTQAGKESAQTYNEEVYVLSLRTILHTLNKPPKNFEGLVEWHFAGRGKEIVEACKAEEGRLSSKMGGKNDYLLWCQTKLLDAFRLLPNSTFIT